MPEVLAAAPRRRTRRLALRDGREVRLRPIAEADAPEIVQAFERLSAESRYNRFMQARKEIDGATLERGLHPRPGRDYVLVATVPAADGIDIVGAAQYVGTAEGEGKTCEFAITVAENWRGSGLATELLGTIVRHAARNRYDTMEGWVLAGNGPMLALARRLDFVVEPVPGDGTVVRVQRALRRKARAAARNPH